MKHSQFDDTGYDASYEEKIKNLEQALDDVLKANTLTAAKEAAADALDVDVDEFLIDDLDEDFMEDISDYPRFETEW